MRRRRWPDAARPARGRAALCAALASLVATLFLCLGTVTPDVGHAGLGHTTAVAGAPAVEVCALTPDGTELPPSDRCCAPAAHGVRAVPASAEHALPPALRPLPHGPARPAPGPAPGRPSDHGAPDLHVLQVQRT
ncbi:hypothetical protein [Streptomyces luteocolor]|uniref:hypothetical protein n=1 Tax=Streptomyces luteocolor TaxID=285500 RepID=UPI00085306EB|nr:hypothetical protein [Streptomyces luteocolor]